MKNKFEMFDLINDKFTRIHTKVLEKKMEDYQNWWIEGKTFIYLTGVL